MTTSPSDLTWTFQALLGPFRKIGFPVDDISIMAGLSLHFLPLLKEEAERLIMVTKARGIRFDSGGIFERIRHIIGLVPPLLIRIFRRSERIALAMEARGCADTEGYGGCIDDFATPLGHADMYAFGCLLLYLAGAWCIERFLLV
jgi:energy-coupling factor transport system permease protein